MKILCIICFALVVTAAFAVEADTNEYVLLSCQMSARDTNVTTYTISRDVLAAQPRWIPGEDGLQLDAGHFAQFAMRNVMSQPRDNTNGIPQLMYLDLSPLPDRDGFDVMNRWKWTASFLMNPEVQTARSIRADVRMVFILLDGTVVKPRTNDADSATKKDNE